MKRLVFATNNQGKVNEIKQILGIPSQYEVLCVVALGHKAENKAARTEREQKVQQRTHFERF